MKQYEDNEKLLTAELKKEMKLKEELQDGSPTKRNSSSTGGEPTAKRQKVRVLGAEGEIVPGSKVEGPLLLEVPLLGLNALDLEEPPKLQLRAGHVIYITNSPSAQEWTSPPQAFVCAFGRGGSSRGTSWMGRTSQLRLSLSRSATRTWSCSAGWSRSFGKSWQTSAS